MNTTLHPRRTAIRRIILSGSIAAFIAAQSAMAATIYWDTNGATPDSSGGTTANGTWDASTTGNWTTDATGSIGTMSYFTANGGSPSTADVIFSAGANATGTTTITIAAEANTGVTANGITIEEGSIATATSGTFTVGPVLSLGAGGLTIAATAAGASSFNSNTTVGLLADQSWTNSSAALFTASGGITGNATTGNTRTLTLAPTAAGGVTLAGVVGNGTLGGRTALVAGGTGTTTLSGANLFTGGVTINAGGTLTATVANALGAAITVGAVGVTNNGTLNLAVGNVTHSGLSNSMTGNGVVNVTLGTGSNTNILNGNYSGFTGTWNVGIGAAAGAGKVQMNGLDNAAATINLLTHASLFTVGAVTHNAAIVLNGGDTGESFGQLRLDSGPTWAGSVTLAGAMTGAGDGFIGSNSGVSTISGAIGETGGAKTLSKSGPGTIVLSGTSNYSGGTSILNGVLSVAVLNNTGNTGNVGTGSTISLGAGATATQLIYTGAGETTNRVLNLASTTGGVTLTQSGASGNLKFTSALTIPGTAAVDNRKTLTLQGSTAATGEIAGAIPNATAGTAGQLTTSLTKSGTGTWMLSGTNTFTGVTAINAGVLKLNYDVGAGGTNTTKLADAAALTLSGGTLELSGGSHLEIVSATTISAGTNNIVTRSGGTAVLRMNAMTVNSANSVTFTDNGIAQTDALNTNGILGFWARTSIAGVSSWAMNATNAGDGLVTTYAAYTNVAQFLDGAPTGTIPSAAANNVRIVTAGTTGNVALGGGALTQAYTIQNDSSGATIDPANNTDVLNIGDNAGGAIWQTSGAGSLVIGTAAGDGVLTSGATASAAPATLRLINDSVANGLTVNSNITNNTTDVVSLTTTGNGVLTLNGNNTYTGVTTVGSGSGTLGGSGTLILTGTNTANGNTDVGNGATLQLQSAGALAGTGVVNSQLRLFNGSTLQLRADSALTFNGTNGIGSLNAATVGIDVNQLTGAGTNNALTISPSSSDYGNAVTINVTGGNGYSLGLGTIRNVVNATGTLTLNPTTASMTLGAFHNQFAAANTATAALVLGGTASGNSVTGVIANQGAGSAATGITTVTKTGSSTWDLQGANTFTGNMVVREGTLTLSGNRLAAGAIIVVGDTAGLNATLNISNGAWSMGANNLRVANQANTSSVNQTGGSITFTGGDQLLVGAVGGTGSYDLSAGTITGAANANRGVLLGINTGTTGTFNLSGTGNLAMGASALQLSRSDSPADHATAVFNQTGGTATFGSLTVGGGAGVSYLGNSGTLNLTGGTFSAASFTLLGAADLGTAVINLGGTALVTLPAFPTARGAGATATLTFDGGTLSPVVASSAYMGGLTNAFLTANGAKFDVAAGKDITVSQLLQNAVAQTGTLTKLGTGVLTLSGANSYTGTTAVNDGTLVVSGSVAGAATVGIAATLTVNGSLAGAAAIGGGGTLSGSGTVAGNVSVASGGAIVAGSAGLNPLTLSGLTLGAAGGDLANITLANLGGGANAAVVNVTTANGIVANGGAGSVTLTANLLGLPTGVYKLLGYGGAALTTAPFTTAFTNSSRQIAALQDNAGVQIEVNLTSDSVTWTGLNAGGEWSTNTLAPDKNWKLTTALTTTDFITLDDVVFNDTLTTGTNIADISAGDVSPGSVTFNNSTINYAVQGVNGITGIATIVKNGTGVVNLATANTHTGGITLNAGTLNIVSAGALGSGLLTLAGGTFDNTTGLALSAANLQNWGGNFAFTGTNDITLGGATLTADSQITVTSGTYTVSGPVSGAGFTLTKAGAGTLTLNGAGTYTGPTVISGGTLTAGNGAALGTNAGGTTISSGATLNVNGQNLGTEVITVGGTGVGGLGAIVNNGTDQINAIGRIVLTGNTTFGGTNRWDLRNTAPTLDMGGFTITKEGFNQVSLVGVSVSNPGNIVINVGSFAIETTSNVGGSAANSVTANAGASLLFYGNTVAMPWTVNLNDASFLQNNTTATASGPVVLTGANTIGANGAAVTLTLSGVVSGAGNFNKTGTGALLLTNANTYDGATTITTGRVVVSHAGGLGSATGGTSVANNAILQLTGGITTNSGETVSLIGGGSDFFGALQAGTGGGTWAGGVTLDDAAVRIGATTANTLTVTGTIADGAGTGFNVSGQVGTGVVILNPTTSNTYTGATGVIRGILRLGKDDALPTGTTLDVDSFSGVADASTFDLASFDQTVGALQDTATTNLTSLITNSVAATTSALTVDGSTSTSFDGVIQNGAGTVSLAKSGSSTLTLTAVQTYTGGTTVSGGTLQLTGANTGTGVIRGVVTINAGGTLQLLTPNALGYTAGVKVDTVNINGGLLDNIASLDQGFNQVYNLTGGTMQSNGGVSSPIAGQYYAMGTGTAVNTFASATASEISGRLNLRNDNLFTNVTFTVADGAAVTDLLLSAAITQNAPGVGITKAGAGLMEVTGSNSYTGATLITNGTLRADTIVVSGGASSLGNATSAVVLGDATNEGILSYTGGDATYTRGFTVAAGGGEIDTVSGGQTLTIATGGITSASNGSVVIGGAGNTTVTSAIQLGTGAVTKEGAGTLTLTGTQTYATLNTDAGVTNVNSALGSGTSTINADATTNIYVSQTLAALNIGAGAEVTFGDGLPFAGGPGKFGAPALVPEPGTLGLLLIGALGMAARRRRNA